MIAISQPSPFQIFKKDLENELNEIVIQGRKYTNLPCSLSAIGIVAKTTYIIAVRTISLLAATLFSGLGIILDKALNLILKTPALIAPYETSPRLAKVIAAIWTGIIAAPCFAIYLTSYLSTLVGSAIFDNLKQFSSPLSSDSEHFSDTFAPSLPFSHEPDIERSPSYVY